MAMDPLNDTRQFNDHRRLLGPLAILERRRHGHQRQECKKQHTGLPDKHPLSPRPHPPNQKKMAMRRGGLFFVPIKSIRRDARSASSTSRSHLSARTVDDRKLSPHSKCEYDPCVFRDIYA